MQQFIPVFRILLVIVVSTLWSVLALALLKFAGVDLKDMSKRSDPKLLALGGVVNLLIVGTIIIIFKFIDKKSISVMGFGFNLHDIVFTISAIIITTVLAFAFVWVLHFRKVISVRWATHNSTKPGNYLAVLLGFLVLFIAALQEEIVYRGYFTANLSQFGLVNAMIWSSIVFTLWHFITNKVNPYQTIEWFLGGLTLFFAYIASGSIWVAAVLHFSRNFANTIALNIAQNYSVLTFDKQISPLHKMFYIMTLSFVWVLLTYLFYGNRLV